MQRQIRKSWSTLGLIGLLFLASIQAKANTTTHPAQQTKDTAATTHPHLQKGIDFHKQPKTTSANTASTRPTPAATTLKLAPLKFFSAADTAIRYVGRIDFSDPNQPRFWNPGVYLSLYFKGSTCKIILQDQVQYGVQHNYIEVVVDGKANRIRLNQPTDTVEVASGLTDGSHHLVICKDTESNIGFLSVMGVLCQALLPQPFIKGKKRRIECFGDSITCGASSDLSGVPCGAGRWEDQHNCYMSYGPRLARMLDADWVITAVSGIGLMHSCCGLKITLPQVYDKLALSPDSINWDFDNYQPDLATICLGQNDGLQDMDSFCAHYVNFVGQLRKRYPTTTFVLLTSPMADANLRGFLQKALLKVAHTLKNNGDQNIYHYFFKKQYNQGVIVTPQLQNIKRSPKNCCPLLSKSNAGMLNTTIVLPLKDAIPFYQMLLVMR